MKDSDQAEGSLRNIILSINSFNAPRLVPEACRAVIDYAFPTYNLVKLTAFTRAENRQSWRVMEKLGMKQEGLLRQHEVAGNGQRVDQVIYGLLREEWEAQLNK